MAKGFTEKKKKVATFIGIFKSRFFLQSRGFLFGGACSKAGEFLLQGNCGEFNSHLLHRSGRSSGEMIS